MATREEMLAAAERITADAGLRLILASLADLRMALMTPAPVILEPPDLSAIVTAVNGLKPGVDASDIAEAIGRVIQPAQPYDGGQLAVLQADTNKLLERLDFRMRGSQPAFGASGPSNIADNPVRELGLVTVKNPGGPAPAQTRLLDYDVRSDANPVYVGTAAQGSATSDPAWLVQKLTYDLSNRLVGQESLTGQVWDDRATLPW